MSKGFFNFDLMTTVKCNLHCVYCIEAEHFDFYNQQYDEHYNINDVVNFLENLQKEDWFKEKYDGIKVTYWGGEPTLCLNIIKETTDKLVNSSNKYIFYVSSNGYKIDDYIDYINQFKNDSINNQNLFMTQISYDGEPVQSIKRVDRNGNPHTAEVLRTIHKLQFKNIPYVLKSTITLDMLKYLYRCYKDVTRMDYIYFPTIDYRTKQLDEYISNDKNIFEVLKKQLFKIAKDEIPFMRKNNGKSRFSWFNYGREECCAGRDMLSIDIDGNIYKCHGCLSNTTKKEHCIGNITDKNINKQINISIKEYINAYSNIKDRCLDCDAIYCLRCNTSKYECSIKENYWDKWFDYKSQNNLCNFYKYVSNITRAVKLKL